MREGTAQRELSQKKRKTQRERELRSSQRVRERTRAPIQPPTPFYLMPITLSSARWSPCQTPDDCDREAPHRAFAPLSLPSSLNLTEFDDFFFFFLGFVCVSVLRNEWYCNICLATEKLWENVIGFNRIWWFFFLGFICVTVYLFGNRENVSNK